jgi:nucleoside-diphosphate-sugar epimerase
MRDDAQMSEQPISEVVCVTGGAGYLGAAVCLELVRRGHLVRAFDRLEHGQVAVAEALTAAGVDVRVGDVCRQPERLEALDGASAVVHLAAVVGDPACARDPDRADAVNVGAAGGVIADAAQAGIARFVFASTCSNYGRMADPSVPVDENGALRPVSLYARQKVAVEERLLNDDHGLAVPTCLRFATIYGVAPRMRFDLTVNEFTRDLWAGRTLEVFGEQFWRPYVHVQDAAVAVATVIGAPPERVARRVFNVGSTSENYRKADVVSCVQARVPSGTVRFVPRDEDPRDYRVNFDRVRDELGFAPRRTVPDGVEEVVAALRAGAFEDPFDARHGNVA